MLQVRRFQTEAQLNALITQLFDDVDNPEINNSFHHDYEQIEKAFWQARLYGLVEQPQAQTLLPCFCAVNARNEVSMLWTVSHHRRQGWASTLLQQLNVKRARHVFPDTVDFWRNRNIDVVECRERRRELQTLCQPKQHTLMERIGDSLIDDDIVSDAAEWCRIQQAHRETLATWDSFKHQK